MEQKELQVTFDINTIDHLGVCRVYRNTVSANTGKCEGIFDI